MASTKLLDLPPEIRNTIYHLVLCEYRINLTRQGDIPHDRPSTVTIHGNPLALQSVCKTLRKETIEIVPIPVVSMSECWSSDVGTIRVPQAYLHETRRLVIDACINLDTNLSLFVTSMPRLLQVEIHLPINLLHVTETIDSFAGVPDGLDLTKCSYDVENIPEGTQIHLRAGELLEDLEIIQDPWTGVIGKWSTEPRIIVKRSGVHYQDLGAIERSGQYQEEVGECIYVTVR